MKTKRPSIAIISAILFTVLVTAGIVALAAPGWALIQSLLGDDRPFELYELSPFESFLQAAVALVVAGIFFSVGACIGSFLNVLVYRLPLKKPVIWERSHCPRCQQAIRFRDNLPIVGWLKLGGACRSCQLPISLRYPLVEIATGLFFLVFYFRELLSGGANLPLRPINPFTGIVWVLLYTKWDLLGLYLFHCLVFCLLIVLTLPRLDGKRLPLGSLASLSLLAGAAPLLNGQLYPASWGQSPGWWSWPAINLAGKILVSGAIGAASGWLAGVLLDRGGTRWSQVQETPTSSFASIPTWCVSGLILGLAVGWPTLPLVAVGVVLLRLVQRLGCSLWPQLGSLPVEPFLLPTWFLVHCWWRELAWLCLGAPT
jgi:leader peptidase (prepilin peptidase)/N-methyltransferase